MSEIQRHAVTKFQREFILLSCLVDPNILFSILLLQVSNLSYSSNDRQQHNIPHTYIYTRVYMQATSVFRLSAYSTSLNCNSLFVVKKWLHVYMHLKSEMEMIQHNSIQAIIIISSFQAL
jgi:hypothetical protein